MHDAEDDVDVVEPNHQKTKLSVIQYSTIMKLYGKFHEDRMRG